MNRVVEVTADFLLHYSPKKDDNDTKDVEFFTLTPITEGEYKGWDQVTYYVSNNIKQK